MIKYSFLYWYYFWGVILENIMDKNDIIDIEWLV